ncbi:hypothetical protein [Candidatus Enterococcus ferrettii]|uniref:Uncharacterized protein n=1 Tax=Candidatus Enterococcus ferrettii TaxID=2815324 RepID=A0ABV0EL75_9ENTE|nr:hypothetical protein [Enterococcus sp. 665A]MBO1342565.1 hypothetical protein [Enterococcus sp. 665A]
MFTAATTASVAIAAHATTVLGLTIQSMKNGSNYSSGSGKKASEANFDLKNPNSLDIYTY